MSGLPRHGHVAAVPSVWGQASRAKLHRSVPGTAAGSARLAGAGLRVRVNLAARYSTIVKSF